MPHNWFFLPRLANLFARGLRWRVRLLESGLFLLAYLLWLAIAPANSTARPFLGSLAVMVPLVAVALLALALRPLVPPAFGRAYTLLASSFFFWTLGHFSRFYEWALLTELPLPVPAFSLADTLNLLAYPFLFLFLLLYPARHRFFPSRFRFILDALLSAGVVALLAWMTIARPALEAIGRTWQTALPLVYPLLDLVLLMVLFSTSLVKPLARSATLAFAGGLLAFSVSDYVYSYQALIQAYRPGGPESLGWVLGGLAFGLALAFQAEAHQVTLQPAEDRNWLAEPAARLQNLLPFVLLIALIWFILLDWRLRNEAFLPGVLTTLFLLLVLVVRLGVQAGELELYKYWQLFAALAEPVFLCNPEGRFLLVNPAMSRAIQLEEEQILEHRLTDFFCGEAVTPDLLVRATSQPVLVETQFCASGRSCLLSLSPIFLQARRPLLAGAAYDIHEQKAQQQALEQAYHELQQVSNRLEELNAELEARVAERTRVLQEAYAQLEAQNRMLRELDALKSDFVSMVSHELRTPLTSLRGGLELLLQRPDLSLSDRATLELMKGQADRLAHFVENVLSLSSLEAGKLTPHLEPVDLTLLVQDVLRAFSHVPGIERIRVQFPSDLPMVLADENFLHRVLAQLVDNALKYAPEGPIWIDALLSRKRVLVRVTDSGPGIPPEKRPFLFERFQRLQASDAQSVYGYGLGLYLARQLLRAQKSDLHYEAPPEGGARFVFSLKVMP